MRVEFGLKNNVLNMVFMDSVRGLDLLAVAGEMYIAAARGFT